MSAIKAAMDRAGMATGSARLYTTACEVVANSRNLDGATLALVSRCRADKDLMAALARHYIEFVAQDMRGVPEKVRSIQARKSPALVQNDGEVGLLNLAAQAGVIVPASPSAESSEGQHQFAEKASGNLPSAAHNPGHSKRGLASIASIQPAIARSVFDTTKLPDGRSLRQVQWHELPKLSREYRRFSRVFMLLHNKITPPDTGMTLDQVVKESEVIEALENAERFNDVA